MIQSIYILFLYFLLVFAQDGGTGCQDYFIPSIVPWTSPDIVPYYGVNDFWAEVNFEPSFAIGIARFYNLYISFICG